MGHGSPTLIVCFSLFSRLERSAAIERLERLELSRCIPLRRVRLTVNSLYIYERRTRQASSAEPQRRGN